jgi:hypothetical protein
VYLQGAFFRVFLQGGGFNCSICAFVCIFMTRQCLCIFSFKESWIAYLHDLSLLPLFPCTDLLDFCGFFVKGLFSLFAVTIRHIFSGGYERMKCCARNIIQLIDSYFAIFVYFLSIFAQHIDIVATAPLLKFVQRVGISARSPHLRVLAILRARISRALSATHTSLSISMANGCNS